MTWVRYDDNVANHRKVRDLDDATYRLWREAIEWCAHNLTDGVIQAHRLALTSVRASRARARKLVQQGLWHPAGMACVSKKCPPSGEDGWVIHDYWDYQPTREQVRAEQAKAAERVRNWRTKKLGNAAGNGITNAVTNAEPNGVGNAYPAPPRPAPKGRAGTDVPAAPPAAEGGEAAAGVEAEEPTPVPIDTPPDDGFGLVDERSIAAQIAADRAAQQRAAAEHDATTQRGLAAVRAALRRPA